MLSNVIPFLATGSFTPTFQFFSSMELIKKNMQLITRRIKENFNLNLFRFCELLQFSQEPM